MQRRVMTKGDGIDGLRGCYGTFCRSARTEETHIVIGISVGAGGNIATFMAEMRRDDIAHAQELMT
jgi:hypothetical protein